MIAKLSQCEIIAGTRPGFGNLQRIYWRAKPHEAVDAYPETNFVLRHEEWVPSSWVLKVVNREFFANPPTSSSPIPLQFTWTLKKQFSCLIHSIREI